MSVSPDSILIAGIANNTCPSHLDVDLRCFPRLEIDDPVQPIVDFLDALPTAFQTNHTVQSLSFSLNYAYIEGIRPKLAATLLSIIPICPHIKSLQLQRCHLGAEFGCALAKLLTQHQTLKHLALEENDLSDVGGVALAESLKTNTSLSRLDLEYNSLSDISALAIANALAYNHTLGRIDFGYCDLDFRSFKLRRSSSNGHNTISEQGAKAFLQLLDSHQTLQKIHFSSNISEELCLRIKEKISKKVYARLQETLNPSLYRNPIQLIFSYTKHAYGSEPPFTKTKKQKCIP